MTEFDRNTMTKLSKSELIKKCKSCKLSVSTNAKKEDIIDRLIANHLKGIAKYIKIRARPKRFTTEQCVEYLVLGFIRKKRSKKKSKIFPMSLSTLIQQYIPVDFDPHLRFNICDYNFQ